MAMYALAIAPLINKLHHSLLTCKQVWYADYSTAAGSLSDVRKWWDEISSLGPGYRYFPNGSKIYLIVKPEYEEQAHTLFTGSDIEVTTRGHRHLGAVVGSAAFKDEYVRKHVDEWVNEVRCLSDIARTQPHAAYSAFVHGLTGHWSHIMHTIPDIGNLLAALENVIHLEFLPSLSGRPASSSVERKIFALPARLGGLGLINPTACADFSFNFQSSKLKC